ncbi:MAG: ribokinase [Actinomycetes bacterium]|jgi:ribokinase
MSTISSKSPVVVVVGSANIDLTSYARRLPEGGETLIGDSFSEGFGGKGANQAVMAALAGAEVHFIGSVGNDQFGRALISNFEQYGINTLGINIAETSSGIAHIWVDDTGENRILIIPGANATNSPQSVEKALAAIPHLDFIIGQCEIPQEATLAAFQAGKSRGATTILNPAPYEALSDELLAATDWLIPNESEFALLDKFSRLPDSSPVISELRPSKNLIVTLGDEGAAIAQGNFPVIYVESTKVHSIDSTGAGDCFIGSFTAGIGLGLNPQEATRFACQCAAFSVTRKGAQASYPTREESAKFITLSAK